MGRVKVEELTLWRRLEDHCHPRYLLLPKTTEQLPKIAIIRVTPKLEVDHTVIERIAKLYLTMTF